MDGATRRRFVASFRALQEGVLRCKNHPDEPAFSICVRCGMGICRKCTVVLGTRRYCTTDAEMLLKKARMTGQQEKKGLAVSAASVLTYLEGATASLVGVLFIILGLVAPSMQPGSSSYSLIAPTFAFFNPVFAFSQATILSIGSVIFAVGILDILAGTFLWRSSKLAGIASIALAVAGSLVAGIYFAAFAVIAVAAYALIGLAVADIGSVMAGWSRLR